MSVRWEEKINEVLPITHTSRSSFVVWYTTDGPSIVPSTGSCDRVKTCCRGMMYLELKYGLILMFSGVQYQEVPVNVSQL